MALLFEEKDTKGEAIEHIYSVCGYVGLFLLPILATVFQIVATLIPPKTL